MTKLNRVLFVLAVLSVSFSMYAGVKSSDLNVNGQDGSAWKNAAHVSFGIAVLIVIYYTIVYF